MLQAPIHITPTEFNPPTMHIEPVIHPDGSYSPGVKHWSAASFKIDKENYRLPNHYIYITIYHGGFYFRLYNAKISISPKAKAVNDFIVQFDTAEILSLDRNNPISNA